MPKGWPGWPGWRTGRLAPDQLAVLAARVEARVEAGPDPARDGVLRWRRRDLQARIAAAFGVGGTSRQRPRDGACRELHERSLGKRLAALGFRRLSLHPQHPKSDPGAQVACKGTSPKR